MALSEDQKAMLRLLAQRGEQGYEDLSALLGIGADEVHAKALAAAEQLESEGIPAPAIPAPPGGASAAPARKEPEPTSEPAAPAPPAEPSVPAEPAPAEKPQPKPAPAKPAAPASSPGSRLKLPESKGARFAIAANVVAVLAIVLIVVLSAGDDSDDGASGNAGDAPASQETASEAAAATPNLTQAVLSPVDGGDAEGRAIFGRIKKEVILQVQAEGLEPSPQGSSYTVWLYKSPQLALRIGSVDVGESGGIAAQFPLPTELLTLIAGGAFDQIDISLTDTSEYEAEIALAKKEERLPRYIGEDVLRGPITGPAITAARKAERDGK
ncbi:MAG TPA: hypothetical protein VFY48_05375 [Solirubrobacterales bacterium]|nr:hypothetical protein [Solirubrobacterales bacterium]